MSRMLDALQKLSTRPADAPAGDDPPPAEKPAAAVPGPALGPVSSPADHSRRMKELLVKHLTPPRPSELLRNLKAELNRPIERPLGMTVPLEPAALVPPLFPLEAGDDSDESVRESISLTFPMSDGDASGGQVGRMDLLPAIEEQDASAGEEIAVSFGSEEGERARGQESEVKSQEPDAQSRPQREDHHSEIRIQEEQPSVEPVAIVPSSPVESDAPASALTPEPPTTNPESQGPNAELQSPNSEPQNPAPAAAPAAALPLEHLADERPKIEPLLQTEAPPAPVPLVHPPRTISRGKTRLEQRVIDDLADASRSKPYRELADRLAQDLRLLSGRCLLFSGIGTASHGDDLLSHLAALMAEEDAEVLLVDADFTRAGLTVGLGALKETGLGELLEHSGPQEELVLPTLLPNVSVVPSGRKQLPGSLGVVDHLAQLLTKLQERFALVLIDGGTHTQPLSPSLARLCDATYFVVRLGATEARAAQGALKAFRGSGARVMGCVATTAS